MRRIAMSLLLLGAAIGVGFSAGHHSDADGNQVPLGFGQKLAGAWLMTVDFNGPVEGLMLIGADGTVASSNGLHINPDGSTSHLTTAFGSWERIGKDAIALTFLIRIVDSSGALKFYEKAVGEATIEGDLMIGEAMGLVYLPGQDPFDPEEPTIQVVQGPFTAKKNPVERLPQ